MTERIKDIIQRGLPDAHVYVFDPMKDSTHFQAIVVSPSFENLSLVEQQQLVMNHLKEEFTTNAVHALGLKTFTPKTWAAKKHNYGH